MLNDPPLHVPDQTFGLGAGDDLDLDAGLGFKLPVHLFDGAPRQVSTGADLSDEQFAGGPLRPIIWNEVPGTLVMNPVPSSSARSEVGRM